MMRREMTHKAKPMLDALSASEQLAFVIKQEVAQLYIKASKGTAVNAQEADNLKTLLAVQETLRKVEPKRDGAEMTTLELVKAALKGMTQEEIAKLVTEAKA